MTDTAGGLHHVTAIAGPPQPNLDFYTGLLGMRLVKQTVNYFKSIYFRDETRTGSVPFEIATDGPGFTADEPPEALGTNLKLPPWLEPRRDYIGRRLPPVTIA